MSCEVHCGFPFTFISQCLTGCARFVCACRCGKKSQTLPYLLVFPSLYALDAWTVLIHRCLAHLGGEMLLIRRCSESLSLFVAPLPVSRLPRIR